MESSSVSHFSGDDLDSMGKQSEEPYPQDDHAISDDFSEAEMSLEDHMRRPVADLLDELRQIWGMSESSSIRVIGRVVVKKIKDSNKGAFGRELWFLEGLEHPETGMGLLYPDIYNEANHKKPRRNNAFIPAGPSRDILNGEDAVSGKQWAIAELEPSPDHERQKYNNPWLLNVRSGTLRPLSQLPEEWRVTIFGTESARHIATLARDGIEECVRKELLREDEELAQHREKNDLFLDQLAAQRLKAEEDVKAAIVAVETEFETQRAAVETEFEMQRAAVETEFETQRAAVETELETQRKDRDKVKHDIDVLHTQRHSLQQEMQIMELQYRHLKELLLEKADRLTALGLVDKEDIAALIPQMADVEDTRPGIGFEEAMEGDFRRLAPLLQVRLAEGGLLYLQEQLRDFLALLRTRDLVMLAGDSGSGKTSLVRAAAAAFGGICKIIPVKPNWTGPEDLLGYYNPIERSYQATPFLLALQEAARTPDIPYFICLDEMNLARVEHYFADFLSLLEDRSGSPEIHLYTADEERHVVVEQGLFLEMEAEARQRAGLSDTATLEEILRDDKANVELHRVSGLSDNQSVLLHHARLRRSLAAQMRMPTSLTLPKNVWIFGAVNMDDTTYQLSPKVLDRVQVLRFRNPMLTDWGAIEGELQAAKEDYPDDMPPLRLTADEIGVRTNYPQFDPDNPNAAFLLDISRDYLDPLGVEFGLRAVRQSLGYMDAASAAGIDADTAMDNVIKHKILPKMAFDIARPTENGKLRGEVLGDLRETLRARFVGKHLETDTDSFSELGRMTRLAEGNNGIINYWLR